MIVSMVFMESSSDLEQGTLHPGDTLGRVHREVGEGAVAERPVGGLRREGEERSTPQRRARDLAPRLELEAGDAPARRAAGADQRSAAECRDLARRVEADRDFGWGFALPDGGADVD